MIQVYKLSVILFSIFSLSCTADKKNNVSEELPITTMDSLEKKYIYDKIDYFVNEYDPKEDERLRLAGRTDQPYSIDDSLCFYMAKLDKRELIEDDSFRALMGQLVEKKYLGIRDYGTFDPDFFAVYNTSILYDKRKSNKFALNIALQDTMAISKEFNIYASMRTEFLCIDSVILVLDKLPQMQNDSNHKKCMYLVKNNMTGGCKW